MIVGFDLSTLDCLSFLNRSMRQYVKDEKYSSDWIDQNLKANIPYIRHAQLTNMQMRHLILCPTYNVCYFLDLSKTVLAIL